MEESPAKRSWFPSTPKIPNNVSAPQATTPSFIPSSIGEVVPSISTRNLLAPSFSPVVVSSSSTQCENGLPRQPLSSLNPSTSRFVLNVPLLGRPKSTTTSTISANSGKPNSSFCIALHSLI